MTSNSSWRGSDCSEVTTTSELHTMPVMWRSCGGDGDNRGRRGLHAGGDGVRELRQRVCLISH